MMAIMSEQNPTDIVAVLGPVPNDATFSTWRVRLRDGTVTTMSTTNTSSVVVDNTLVEFNEVFARLAKT